jgi:hypothetical protein
MVVRFQLPVFFIMVLALGALTGCASSEDAQDNRACQTPNCMDTGALPLSDLSETEDGSETGSADTTDLTHDLIDLTPPTLGGFGDPCDSDNQCESRYCIESEAGRICTMLCNEVCPEGFECIFIVNSGADAVRICIPERDVLCNPCAVDTDCLGYGAYCLEQADGTFCSTNCEVDPCPEHYQCNTFLIENEGEDGGLLETWLCEPEYGVCSGCLDGDGDGYGQGWNCLGDDCNDESLSTHPGATELCNDLDDDCDDESDENFDLTTDVIHCGGCNQACAYANGEASCIEGSCTLAACLVGFGDCDGISENGCESDFSSPYNCGTCSDLDGIPGEPCGLCGAGVWACDGLGVLFCAGSDETITLNACGGCGALEAEPGDRCGSCESGVWACNEIGELACFGDLEDSLLNSCGGCNELENLPGEPCGTCGSGLYICTTTELTDCAGDGGDSALNACGGCDLLENPPGLPCGPCNLDSYACDGEITACSSETFTNDCGGCVALEHPAGELCGTCELDEYVCTSSDSTTCNGDTTLNACGGCGLLDESPGGSCGTCDSGDWACNLDGETLYCAGDDGLAAMNSCGGCGLLDSLPGTPCGSCGLDIILCNSPESVVCSGESAFNSCGGCTPLENEPGIICGPCDLDQFVCDGIENTICSGETPCPTSCGDGVLDPDEEFEPLPGPYSFISLNPETCRWDFSAVNQLYCNGSCTWAGGDDCDQEDANILCQLIMDNPASVATGWSSITALSEPGFSCPGDDAELINTDRGVPVPVYYQDTPGILDDHGPGNVIAYPSCTDP